MLKPAELKKEKVDLGDGDFVYVREMTGREKDRWEKSLMKEIRDEKTDKVVRFERDFEDTRAKIVVNTACDENGNLLFKFEDYEKLSQIMPAERISKIAKAATDLNGINKEEEVIKNLDPVQSAELPSASGGTAVVSDSVVSMSGLQASQPGN